MHKTPQIRCLLTPLAFIVFIAPAASGQVASSPGILSTDKREQPFRNWSEAKSVDPDGSLKVNTAVQDGCPIESPDGSSSLRTDPAAKVGRISGWISGLPTGRALTIPGGTRSTCPNREWIAILVTRVIARQGAKPRPRIPERL